MTDASKYLIFGATGGIGAALARRLADTGATVVISGRDERKLAALGDAVGVEHVRADGCNPDDVNHAFETTLDRHGALSGVASCIGSMYLKPAHLTSPADWSTVLDTNLSSAFYIVRGAGQHMARSGGSVALVSSAAATLGMANHEAIAAAKAGVAGLVRAAAATYAPRGLRFNAVAPGLVETGLTAALVKTETGRKLSTQLHPLGRLGQPEDIASAIAWLLDPAQSWVTGQLLGVDGGLAAVQPRPRTTA